MTARLALFALVLAGGAQVARADDRREIRDVRPQTIQRGDVLVVEGWAFDPAAGATVELAIGGRVLTFPARAVSRERVLVDVDDSFVRAVGAPARGPAMVRVVQPSATGGDPIMHTSRAPFALDLLPPTLRSVAERWTEGRPHAPLLHWLGLGLEVQDGTVVVAAVEGQSSVEDLVRRLDQPPYDGQLTPAELAPAAAEVRALGLDPTRPLSRADLARVVRPPSPAAKAGLTAGDRIVSLDGTAVASIDELVRAYRRASGAGDLERAAVRVVATRAGAPVEALLPTAGAPADTSSWIGGLLLAAACLGVLMLLGPGAGLIVVWERKIAGRMQSRIGPNRVGPNGWLQWLADAVKLITKEDLVPADAHRRLFQVAPYFAFVGLVLTFIVLPFSERLQVVDLDVGLLFLGSVTSLVVVSILMGGWASNSKWSLLGGMRSAAQIISYELPASIALLCIAARTGSLSLQRVIGEQGGAPWHWNAFADPFCFSCFIVYFISALAEGNRTPFDLPEAESELVSGYNTEYSGFRFGVYPMVEWINLYVIGAIASAVFLGGWHLPHVAIETLRASPLLQALSLLVFMAKAVGLVFVVIWVRWTLPRFRIDQMMRLCWTYLLPISLASLVGVLLSTWLLPPAATRLVGYATFAVFGLGLGGWFASRVRSAFGATGRVRRMWEAP